VCVQELDDTIKSHLDGKSLLEAAFEGAYSRVAGEGVVYNEDKHVDLNATFFGNALREDDDAPANKLAEGTTLDWALLVQIITIDGDQGATFCAEPVLYIG
jgi:hypothetical protein